MREYVQIKGNSIEWSKEEEVQSTRIISIYQRRFWEEVEEELPVGRFLGERGGCFLGEDLSFMGV